MNQNFTILGRVSFILIFSITFVTYIRHKLKCLLREMTIGSGGAKISSRCDKQSARSHERRKMNENY